MYCNVFLSRFDWEYFKSVSLGPRAFAPSWKIQMLKRQKVKLMPQFPKVKAGWLDGGYDLFKGFHNMKLDNFG